jgi:predicted TIM-barrel fold metal-dependent hydrolase
MSATSRIDVHHHLIPPAFREAMARRGIVEVAGTPLPNWSPRASLEVMETNAIGTAILSLSAPGVHFGDVEEARSLARACNEYSAQMMADHAGRFGMFAVLPMPFADHACAEAVYALDVLKADGVVLLGSTDGVFLGDARFDELMAELDRRHAIVFVHPNLHPSTPQIGLAIPGFVMEFLCDTTRAALNIILSGTAEKYPSIRWIFSHAGGFLPYIAWRASLTNGFKQYEGLVKDGVLTHIRRFYYDTALSPAAYSMAALKALVEPSQILFGSDFPFAPAPLVGVETRTLDDSEVWTAGVKRAIDRTNALALFPRFASRGEKPARPKRYRRTLRGRIMAAATAPLVSLLETVRNR